FQESLHAPDSPSRPASRTPPGTRSSCALANRRSPTHEGIPLPSSRPTTLDFHRYILSARFSPQVIYRSLGFSSQPRLGGSGGEGLQQDLSRGSPNRLKDFDCAQNAQL